MDFPIKNGDFPLLCSFTRGYWKNPDLCTLRSEMIPADTQAAPADRYPDAWWAEMGSRGLPEMARLDWEIGLDCGVFWLRKHSVQLDNVHLLVWSCLVYLYAKTWCHSASIWVKLGWVGSWLMFLPMENIEHVVSCSNTSIHILLEVSKTTLGCLTKGYIMLYPQNSNFHNGNQW